MVLKILKNQRLLLLLILLDLGMAITAFTVDFSDFSMVPWYLWIFTPICPLWPFLLGINFFKFRLTGHFWVPLLHFTAIGIISYGLMAFIFYPTYMLTHGFAWYELGNIFWVTLYASQIFLVWPFLKKIPVWWYLLFTLYFIPKDLLDRFGPTFSYQRLGDFTDSTADFLVITLITFHIIVFLLMLILLRRRPENEPRYFQ